MTIDNTMAEWEENVLRSSLDKSPETREDYRTLSGNPVKPLYTPLDVRDIDYERDIGFPGQFPFTRGRMPNGYRSWVWPHDFYAGYGSGESANARFHDLINHGATVISLAFDLPTQIGLDSDFHLCRGEVGKAGLALTSLPDLERALDGIDLRKIGISYVANCIGPYTLAATIGAVQRRGMDPRDVKKFRLQNDPIREYTGRGTHILPIDIAVEMAVDVIEYVCRNYQDRWYNQWSPQYVNTTHLRLGGSTAPQEIGFGIAHCFTYMDAALRRGLSLSDFVPKMDLHMAADSDLFEEVAKFRATRRLWARLVKERYHCEDPNVLGLRLTMGGGNHRMTAQQPLNNLARLTVQVLAALLGGVEQMYCPGYDEALALPTSESARISAQIKLILHHECGLQNTVDPMAGSYMVERLTNDMEEQGRYWLDKVEGLGGVVGAVKDRLYFKEMDKGQYENQRKIESGERVVIGINKLKLDEEIPMDIFQLDPGEEERQVERLRKIKRERDAKAAGEKLARLKDVALRKKASPAVNTVPAILEAVQANCTIGEIHDVFREIFGEYGRA